MLLSKLLNRITENNGCHASFMLYDLLLYRDILYNQVPRWGESSSSILDVNWNFHYWKNISFDLCWLFWSDQRKYKMAAKHALFNYIFTVNLYQVHDVRSNLAGVILDAGSASSIPASLQVNSTPTTLQIEYDFCNNLV